MKICIPTETGDGKTAQVYGHFGSAPFFTIYDTDAKSIEVVDNANKHHEHGTCNPVAALRGRAVDVVVTGGMGARAVMMLNAQGIKHAEKVRRMFTLAWDPYVLCGGDFDAWHGHLDHQCSGRHYSCYQWLGGSLVW